MDRNQIDRGSMGVRLRSRLGKQLNGPSRIREGWPGRCDPQGRSTNASLRGAEFSRFAREVERDLDPRGPLERIVARHATRAAWELQNDLGSGCPTGQGSPDGTSSAARTLKISITTLDLLQGRRNLPIDPATHDDCSLASDEYEAVVLAPNEWPSLPAGFDAATGEVEADDEPEADDTPIWRGRLVFDFDISDDSPIVRGTWITVSHIVNLIVDGATWADILRSHPELTEDDIRVCVAYAVAEDDAVL